MDDEQRNDEQGTSSQFPSFAWHRSNGLVLCAGRWEAEGEAAQAEGSAKVVAKRSTVLAAA